MSTVSASACCPRPPEDPPIHDWKQRERREHGRTPRGNIAPRSDGSSRRASMGSSGPPGHFFLASFAAPLAAASFFGFLVSFFWLWSPLPMVGSRRLPGNGEDGGPFVRTGASRTR